MLDLMRMNTRRLLRARAVYITLAALIGVLALFFLIAWIASDPGMLAKVESMGAVVTVEERQDAQAFLTMSRMDFMAQMFFQGGLISCVMSIFTVVLVKGDFSSGFIKNIASFRARRGGYLPAWQAALSILTAFYMAVLMAVAWGIASALGVPAQAGDLLRLAEMFLLGLVIFSAQIAQTQFFCMLVRGPVLAGTLSVLAVSGVFAAAINGLTAPFGLSLMQYTLAGSAAGILACMEHPLPSVALCAAWLVLYQVLGTWKFKRMDVC